MAAIAIPRLGGFRDNAAKSADLATARTLESATAIYYAATGEYPDTLEDLETAVDGYEAAVVVPTTFEWDGWNENTWEDAYDNTDGSVSLTE